MDRSKFYQNYRKHFETRLSQLTVDAIESLLDAFETYQVDKYKASYILASVRHEVGYKMQTKTESLYYTTAKRINAVWPSRFNLHTARNYTKNSQKLANKVYGGRLGNNDFNDGYLYRGRGFIQITGKTNYIRFSRLLGHDLVNSPQLANDNKISACIAVYGCLNGLFTGRKLSDYINQNKLDYVNARRVVNGDVRRVGESIAKNAKVFENILQLSDYSL